MFPFYDKTLISVVTSSELLKAEWTVLIGKEKCQQATTMETKEGIHRMKKRQRGMGDKAGYIVKWKSS